MKYKIPLLALLFVGIGACKNESKDSVERADSINEAKTDTSSNLPKAITADEASTHFLVDAANGGLTGVRLGKLAQQKAKSEKVKNFATMMVNDHTSANDQVRSLASQRNITLPTEPGDDKKKMLDDLDKKTGADFDKAVMKSIIDEHQKSIDVFERASNRVNDTEVKAFADNTLPKLRMHLDSARVVRDGLR